MKPILQINHIQRGSGRDNRPRHSHKGFPLTDYNYHPTAESQVNSSARWRATKSPAFHKLSSEFFGAEAYRDYVTNFFVFTLLGLITAWPIFSMIVAVTQMARGY